MTKFIILAGAFVLAGIGIAFGQVGAPPASTDPTDIANALAYACDNQATLAKVFEWLAGILGIPVGASLLQNFKSRLAKYPMLSTALNFVALNFFKEAPKALLALFVLGLAACAANTMTPPQVAALELSIALAAENAALAVEPTLPPTIIPAVQAGGAALAAQVAAQVPVLMSGGSTAAQIEAAGLAGIVPVINNLGKLLTVTGGSVDPKAVALTGGEAVLQQLPEVVGVVVQINSGWIPAAADIASAQAAVAAAAAKL